MPARHEQRDLSRHQLDPGDVATDCYELNIAGPDNPFPTGSLVEPTGGARRISTGMQWQTFEVQVQSGHIWCNLDGKQVLDYTDPQPLRRGRIGLQLNQGRIAFRNIRLRPLGLERIFNGQDLSGWKSYPDMPSKFTVTGDGQLNVQNGSGQLETERSYGDFVLQLECISHAPGLNSGIFFRCIPGEKMNGYESQIHNGFQARGSQPAGRLRHRRHLPPRQCATCRGRRPGVVPQDDRCRRAARGRVGQRLSGHRLDRHRPADPNPRKGLRVEPGTIMIQGHDPTTNLSFRHLRAAELPGR